MHRLRWAFEYSNGSKKVGMWDNSGEAKDIANKWWANVDGAIYALVESKDLSTSVVKEVLRCPIKEFKGFQYIAFTKILGTSGTGPRVTRNIGLKVLTDKEEIEVYNFGKLNRKEKTHDHISIHMS